MRQSWEIGLSITLSCPILGVQIFSAYESVIMTGILYSNHALGPKFPFLRLMRLDQTCTSPSSPRFGPTDKDNQVNHR